MLFIYYYVLYSHLCLPVFIPLSEVCTKLHVIISALALYELRLRANACLTSTLFEIVCFIAAISSNNLENPES